MGGLGEPSAQPGLLAAALHFPPAAERMLLASAQPYASICGERGKTIRNDFANAKLSPLPQSSRERSTRELSELDPAASALDQLFDFSEW